MSIFQVEAAFFFVSFRADCHTVQKYCKNCIGRATKKGKKEKQFCDNIAHLKTIIIAADLSSYWLLVLFTQNLLILFGRAIEGENEGRGRCRKWQHAKRRRRWGKRRRRGRRFNGVRMEKKETRTGQVLHEEKTRLSNLENKLIAFSFKSKFKHTNYIKREWTHSSYHNINNNNFNYSWTFVLHCKKDEDDAKRRGKSWPWRMGGGGKRKWAEMRFFYGMAADEGKTQPDVCSFASLLKREDRFKKWLLGGAKALRKHCRALGQK